MTGFRRLHDKQLAEPAPRKVFSAVAPIAAARVCAAFHQLVGRGEPLAAAVALATPEALAAFGSIIRNPKHGEFAVNRPDEVGDLGSRALATA